MSTSKSVWIPDGELYTLPPTDPGRLVLFSGLNGAKFQPLPLTAPCFSPFCRFNKKPSYWGFFFSPQCRWKWSWNQSVLSFHLSHLPKDLHLCSKDDKSNWYVIRGCNHFFFFLCGGLCIFASPSKNKKLASLHSPIRYQQVIIRC